MSGEGGSGDAKRDSEPQVVDIRVRLRVVDPQELVSYARARYAACWFDDDWSPRDIAEAAGEALVNSNENPSPDEYGIEIVLWSAATRGD